MNHLLQQAILLNNEGARLLTSGRALSSLQAIRGAGKVLRSIGWNAKTQHPVDDDLTALTLARPQQESRDFYASYLHKASSTTPFYVYNRLLQFPSFPSTDTREDFDSAVDTFSTYIVFNLAVASHMYGMMSSKQAPLRRAMKLYRALLSAPNVMSQLPMSGSLLACIVLNNLCHLHTEMHQCIESHHCLQCMRELVQFTGCLSAENTSKNCMTPYEANEMILNILLHNPPTTAIAA